MMHKARVRRAITRAGWTVSRAWQPRQQFVRLKYLYESPITITNNPSQEWWVFRCNGPFDPYQGVGGSTPSGYADYQGEYVFQRTNFAKLTFHVHNRTTKNIEAGVVVMNSDTSPSSVDSFRHQPGARTRIIHSTSTVGDSAFFKKSVNIRKQFGLSKGMFNQEKYSSDTGSTPSTQCYFIFGAWAADKSASTLTVDVHKVQIDYWIQFYSRKEAPRD